MEIDRIYNEDCIETMKRMPDNFIDLTVTSPPYDNLRKYNGFCFDFENVAKQLYRVTKEGGVLVWVVSDATIDGSETLTSFRQALYFKEIGFNVHDTMIWEKTQSGSIGFLNRYEQTMEYMFVLSKGIPKNVNLIYDKPNKHAGVMQHGAIRLPDGSTHRTANFGKKQVNEFGRRHNVWVIPPKMSRKDNDHPAPFPEKLAADHIRSWSNEGDLVYDCFMGSGTTAKMAMTLNRHYIGSEISEEYCKIIDKRLLPLKTQYRLFDNTPLLPK